MVLSHQVRSAIVKWPSGPGAQTVRRVVAVAGAGVAWRLHRTGRFPLMSQVLERPLILFLLDSDQLCRLGPDQVRVFWYREWVADPRSTYLAILSFLGLEDDGRSEFPIVNRGVRFRARWLVRTLYDPPKSVRKMARLFKRATGMQRQTQDKLIEKTVRLFRTPGYRNEISPVLRDEIRRLYAEDNRRLNKLLTWADLSSAKSRGRG